MDCVAEMSEGISEMLLRMEEDESIESRNDKG